MKNIKDTINFFNKSEIQFQLQSFRNRVRDFFDNNPVFYETLIVHSVKSRIKNSFHLEDKIIRKQEQKGVEITKENLFSEITDLIGVRVLHLYFDQFHIIHKEIMRQIEQKEWVLFEEPKAYTWDPETVELFNKLGIKTVRKDSYTSMHYVVKPNNNKNAICCEIQVRTLFEEIWGEIDHSINYPNKTKSIACSEQLKVLSKLASTGTRLADSIYRSHNEHINNKS